MESQQARRYIIQITHLGSPPSLDEIRTLLRNTGVEIDPDYGPIPLDPERGQFAVRGIADAGARGRAEKLPGVKFFGDTRIKPAS